MPAAAATRLSPRAEPVRPDADTAPEQVEVRCGSEGVGAPTQFLRRAELWLVRQAAAERGVAVGEGWRVVAGQGPGRAQQAFRLSRDAVGCWWLQQVQA